MGFLKDGFLTGIVVFLVSASVLPACAQYSLEELQTRYNTYLGSVVVVIQDDDIKPYRYQGEVMGQLQKVPAASREAAGKQLMAQSGLSENEIDQAVVLLGLSDSTPTFINRKYVYRYEDALVLRPDEVAALNIPGHLLRKRLVGVREVPWEIAQSPEYLAERAANKAEEAAFLAAVLLMLRAGDQNAGDDLPSCLTPVRNSEGREIVLPC